MIKKNLITKQGDNQMKNITNENNTIAINTKIGKVNITFFELIIKDYSDAGEDPYYIANIQAVFKQDNPWSARYFDNETPREDMHDFLRTIEDVTKNMIDATFPELKGAEIHYSEQGMQGKNFMDMDVHFVADPINGEKFGRIDEKKSTEVFSKIIHGDKEGSVIFSIDENTMKAIA